MCFEGMGGVEKGVWGLFVIEALPTQRRVVRKTHGDIERCLEAGTRHCRDHCITFQGVCKNSWNTKETK